MAATRYDIEIEQGADYDLVVDVLRADGVTAADLTGWTARMQARSTVDSTSTLFSSTPTVAAAGTITIHIPAATTAAYTWLSGVYDVEITDGTLVNRILRGNITVSPEVTR